MNSNHYNSASLNSSKLLISEALSLYYLTFKCLTISLFTA